MIFYVDRAFTYRDKNGRQRHVPPGFALFDTNDPARELDNTFVPPIVGLIAGDAEAQAALETARVGYQYGVQYPGIGTIPPNNIHVP